MKVRPATQEDAETIFYFIQKLEETSFDYLLFTTYFAQNISDADKIYLVAETNKTIVGYISCHGQILLHHLAKVFEIQELFVKEEYRNLNVGRLLVEALEDRIKEKGYTLLEVTANAKRTRTHQFYVNCGFTQTHVKFVKTLK